MKYELAEGRLDDLVDAVLDNMYEDMLEDTSSLYHILYDGCTGVSNMSVEEMIDDAICHHYVKDLVHKDILIEVWEDEDE